jgi:hypothetical protein
VFFWKNQGTLSMGNESPRRGREVVGATSKYSSFREGDRSELEQEPPGSLARSFWNPEGRNRGMEGGAGRERVREVKPVGHMCLSMSNIYRNRFCVM